MKTTCVVAVFVGLFLAAPARAAIILEFFRGAGPNDSVLNLAQPINAGNPLVVSPVPGPTDFPPGTGIDAFVQVALRQFGTPGDPGAPLGNVTSLPPPAFNGPDGLAAYLIQGVFDGSGSYFIPASNGLATGNMPVVNVADPGTYTLVPCHS